MYYSVAKQKIDTGFVKRSVITVANKEYFEDLVDDSSIGNPPRVIIEEDEFNELLKHGYPTKEDAVNDDEMMQALKDFIGFLFVETEYMVVDANELKNLYAEIRK